MAAKKRGLGKGLNQMIPDKIGGTKTSEKNTENGASEPKTVEKIVKVVEKSPYQMVNISKVEPNRDQPRKEFDKAKLKELSDSIKAHGIIQPLLVQDKKDYYEIIAGERRWRAAKMAGLKEVPVVIGDYSERDIMEKALIENIQREDLNPIEEAIAFRKLIDDYKLKQDQLAKTVSKSRTYISNSMRLLKLSEDLQKYVSEGALSAGHARALLGLESEELRAEAAKQIMENDLSVRDTEKLVKKLQKAPAKKPEKEAENNEQLLAILENMESQMSHAWGTKVKIVTKNGIKGKIEIDYYNNDDLERIMEFIMASGNKNQE